MPLTRKSPVRLLFGLSSPEAALLDTLTGRLALEFGAAGLVSLRWMEKCSDPELGVPGETLTLTRQWLAFDEPLDPIRLPAVKRHALRTEALYADPHQRLRIRLDAAYLDPLRVVRATISDAAHRIYLGDGIYGEVLLRWRESGGFAPLPWTPSTATTPELLEFLARVHRTF